MKKRIAAAYRYSRAIWIGLAIALAVLLVSSVSVDLGPALKARAERAGSNWLDRPMHIGRRGVHIARGRLNLLAVEVEFAQRGDAFAGDRARGAAARALGSHQPYTVQIRW